MVGEITSENSNHMSQMWTMSLAPSGRGTPLWSCAISRIVSEVFTPSSYPWSASRILLNICMKQLVHVLSLINQY